MEREDDGEERRATVIRWLQSFIRSRSFSVYTHLLALTTLSDHEAIYHHSMDDSNCRIKGARSSCYQISREINSLVSRPSSSGSSVSDSHYIDHVSASGLIGVSLMEKILVWSKVSRKSNVKVSSDSVLESHC